MIALLLALTLHAPPVTGCHLLAAEDVVRVTGGWVVLSHQAHVHEWDVGLSGDDRYWGCWRNGEMVELKIPYGRDQEDADEDQ